MEDKIYEIQRQITKLLVSQHELRRLAEACDTIGLQILSHSLRMETNIIGSVATAIAMIISTIEEA